MKSSSKWPRRILTVLLILTLAFIWGHSMAPADDSSAESGFVLQLITPLLEIFTGKGNVTEHLVRKLAHFAEYMVLGVELGGLFGGDLRKYLIAATHGLLAAFVDETIQLFVSGRSGQVQDVWLDLSGICLGAGIAALIILAKGRGNDS